MKRELTPENIQELKENQIFVFGSNMNVNHAGGTASATGYQGTASATGDRGAASATGDQGAASATGKDSIALAAGYRCKAKGAIGCWIVLAERGRWSGDTYPIKEVKAFEVDGEKVKADTWYMLVNGQLKEV